MYTVYGIPNCDTIKKAKKHLDSLGLDYEFINFKKTPPTKDLILKWKDAFTDWPVNKRGPTYRKIKDEFEGTSSEVKKCKILMEQTSAIKRPIIMKKSKVVLFGYDAETYDKL